ncbi:MAG: Uncharacterised protein [Opitutia bacterium UBA7350]|nr:MAG: Uncharacterised protein [Opitutae bacterium UBA7350]
MPLKITITLCYFLLATFCFAVDEIHSMRIWNSDDGRSMEAKVLDASNLQAIRFRLHNGRLATIPITRLSKSDQVLLRSWDERQKSTAKAIQSKTTKPTPLPSKVLLKRVPMIQQFGNFCVPASAAMIANFHEVEVDQYQIAQLSSAESADNKGTYPSDMAAAIKKLGLSSRILFWNERDKFHEIVLPKIRESIVQEGPIYISFKPGVFGNMGHGCVVVGYDDRKEELLFHNPWGNEFELEYEAVAVQASGLVFIEPPKAFPVASDAMIEQFKKSIPTVKPNLEHLCQKLHQSEINFELIWCNRIDSMKDNKFAKDTAREEGRPMLKLAFRRNAAVIIPYSPRGKLTHFYLVTRAPRGGASYLARKIGPSGWSGPEIKTLGSLTREWSTLFKAKNGDEFWQLPLLEIME